MTDQAPTKPQITQQPQFNTITLTWHPACDASCEINRFLRLRFTAPDRQTIAEATIHDLALLKALVAKDRQQMTVRALVARALSTCKDDDLRLGEYVRQLRALMAAATPNS